MFIGYLKFINASFFSITSVSIFLRQIDYNLYSVTLRLLFAEDVGRYSLLNIHNFVFEGTLFVVPIFPPNVPFFDVDPGTPY